MPNGDDNDQNSTEESIEGGLILLSQDREPIFHERKHRAETSKMLISKLVRLMALSVLLYPVGIVALTMFGFKDTAAELRGVFNIWLTAIVGLVAHGTGHYFAKENR